MPHTASRYLAEGPRVGIRHFTQDDGPEFTARVRESTGLHRPWLFPPATAEAYTAYAQRLIDGQDRAGFLVCEKGGQGTAGSAGATAGPGEGIITGPDEGVITGADEGLIGGPDEGVITGADEGLIGGPDEGVITGADEGPGDGPRAGAIAGYININNIVRGAFQSGALGYGAFAHAAGRGLMREALGLVIEHAFGPMGLHRLEINVQPGNTASIALARSCGFRLEGYSPDMLHVDGAWRDHQRWALTAGTRTSG
ncbi:GNAT family N-acetyltransferase [Streptomyces sp. NPDC056160]|uniref:GNAT family N-acetyltransferase n=1 Tax=Streptomyces sp. NPDC056160 TaxID=3345731 RepID=UPI0035E0D458